VEAQAVGVNLVEEVPMGFLLPDLNKRINYFVIKQIWRQPMKKRTVLSIVLALLLTACSGTASATQASPTQESASLPTATQLVVGTFKLEYTDQAVTSEQAKDLLVMWEVYQNLISSDTAAQAEIDALVEQIQETMTTDQIIAIQAMNLTQQDVFAVTQEQGGDFTQQSSSGNTSSFSPNAGSGPPDGGGAMPNGGGDMGGGAPPDGGMGGMGGTGSSTSTGQTQDIVAGSDAGSSTNAPTALVEALIQVLQQKVAA